MSTLSFRKLQLYVWKKYKYSVTPTHVVSFNRVGRQKRRNLTFLELDPVYLDLYRAAFPLKVEIVHGRGIHDIFRHHRGKSCMRYKKCHGMRMLYENNPEDVGVIVARKQDNPGLCASVSALVWHGKSCSYIDRVYTENFNRIWSRQQVMFSFESALKDACGLPVENVYDDSDIPAVKRYVTFRLKHHPSRPLPYMDSLCYLKRYNDREVWLSTRACGQVIKDPEGTILQPTPPPPGVSSSECCMCNHPGLFRGADGRLFCLWHHSSAERCKLCNMAVPDNYFHWTLNGVQNCRVCNSCINNLCDREPDSNVLITREPINV